MTKVIIALPRALSLFLPRLFFAWICLNLCTVARAQQPTTGGDRPPLSAASIGLTELLRAARTNLPAVLSALATLKRVQAEQALAEGAYLPRLTGEASAGASYDTRSVVPEEDRINAVGAYAGAALSFEWTAFDAARSRAVEGARAAQRGQRLSVKDAERLALSAAVELYLRALAATELVADAALTVQRRTQEHDAIEALARAGVRPSVDALRANVEVLAARYVNEMRQIEERATFAALAASIGSAPERGLRPEALAGDLFSGPSGVDEVSALAQKTRPELAQLREQIRVEQEAYEEAQMRRRPTAGVFANSQASYLQVLYGSGNNGALFSSSTGLFMRWSAADPAVLRQAQVAAGKLSEARRKLDQLSLSVRSEAVDAAYREQRTRAQLEQASQVLEAARATRSAQLERYQVGVASLLELLDAESLEQTARRTRIEAERDHEIARAHVLSATGAIERLIQ